MAITTMDELVAGALPYGEDVLKTSFTAEAIGVWHSSIYIAGRPGASVAPTGAIAGSALTSYAGTIPFPAAVGGEEIYLHRLEFSHTANIGAVTLMDRLWHNASISSTTTTAQTINSATLPARDQNGSTNGEGVMAAIEVSTITGNGGTVTAPTISYTNQSGTSGRTGTLIQAFPASAQVGTFLPFTLAAGDTGIRSIQSLTLNATLTSGTIHLVMYREMASLGCAVPNCTASAGPLELGLPRMYDQSVPFLVFTPLGTAGGQSNAQVTYAQG